MEITNLTEQQIKRNRKIFLGILLGIILLIVISLWWLS
jgi:tetrahydromethanopterin S-methyltransferase subunit G